MPGVLAVAGGTLFDGTGGAPVPGANVLVEDGRILAAGTAAAVPVPAGATVIDATGKTVLPGLIEMHVHVALGAGRDGPALWLANGAAFGPFFAGALADSSGDYTLPFTIAGAAGLAMAALVLFARRPRPPGRR